MMSLVKNSLLYVHQKHEKPTTLVKKGMQEFDRGTRGWFLRKVVPGHGGGGGYNSAPYTHHKLRWWSASGNTTHTHFCLILCLILRGGRVALVSPNMRRDMHPWESLTPTQGDTSCKYNGLRIEADKPLKAFLKVRA